MMLHEQIEPIWQGERCIVAATGPSLTADVAHACLAAHAIGAYKMLAVSDAWRLMPWADALYSCDAAWWDHHKGTSFAGPRWSSHKVDGNDKLECARRWGLNLAHGRGDAGFSSDPGFIHYGSNSGFQAINLAMHFGARQILLVGFNLCEVDGKRHFFGDHPGRLQRGAKYERFLPAFAAAARRLPFGVSIVNCTPQSALKCFPQMRLEDALALVEAE